MSDSPFLILGVTSNATTEEIKAAYRKRAKETHPDQEGGSDEDFHLVQMAYETLMDHELLEAWRRSGKMKGAQKVDPKRERAMKEIFPLLAKTCQQLQENPEVLKVDVIASFKAEFHRRQTDCHNSKVKFGQEIATISKMLGRFVQHDPEGTNDLEMMLQTFIRDAYNAIARIEDREAQIKETLAVLETYSFTKDEIQLIGGTRDPARGFVQNMLGL